VYGLICCLCLVCWCFHIVLL